MKDNGTTVSRRVGIIIYPGVAPVDVGGPLDAFAVANVLSGQPVYETFTVAKDGQAVAVAGDYMRLLPTHDFAKAPADIDTLIVAGGPTAKFHAEDRDFVAGAAKIWARTRRVASICTGAHILAATGLANGGSLATHWAEVDLLRARYPNVTFEGTVLFRISGAIWSSGGMVAGIDLALAMIAHDLGYETSIKVAQFMGVDMLRYRLQRNTAAGTPGPFAAHPMVELAKTLIEDNMRNPLSLDELASRVGTSARTLQRAFAEQTGRSIRDYLAEARLRYACLALSETELSVKEIALRSGLGSAANLRRQLLKQMGLSPLQYRQGLSTCAGFDPTKADA